MVIFRRGFFDADYHGYHDFFSCVAELLLICYVLIVFLIIKICVIRVFFICVYLVNLSPQASLQGGRISSVFPFIL